MSKPLMINGVRMDTNTTEGWDKLFKVIIGQSPSRLKSIFKEYLSIPSSLRLIHERIFALKFSFGNLAPITRSVK